MPKLFLEIKVLSFLFCLLCSVCIADQGSTKKPADDSSKMPEVIEVLSKDLSDIGNRIFETFTGAFKAVKESFDEDGNSGQSQKKLKAEPDFEPEKPNTEDRKELEAKYQPSKIDNMKEQDKLFEESDDLESIFEDDSDVIFETQE